MFKSTGRGRSRQFVLGRSSRYSDFGKSKQKYRKRLELALVITLFLALISFRLSTDIEYTELSPDQAKLMFELIDIPEIPPVIEEKPKMKMEEVIELPPEEQTAEESEESDNSEEIGELLGEDEERVELALASDRMGDLLLSNSPLGTVSGPQLDVRESRAERNGHLKLRKGSFYYDGSEKGVEVDKGEVGRREFVSEQTGIDLSMKSEQPARRPERPKKQEASLGITGKGEKILSSASSTIGTEDWKLWNKINAELDRHNKGRYGSVPDQIHRYRGGFYVRFSYSDGVQHEVHWRNDGNVWIKIIGESNKTSLDELRRVLSALLRLGLK